MFHRRDLLKLMGTSAAVGALGIFADRSAHATTPFYVSDQEKATRLAALVLLRAWLPAEMKAPRVPADAAERFRHITDSKYMAGKGTTCGFVPAWLYWALGCRDVATVQRAHAPLCYRNGENIIRLHSDVCCSGACPDGRGAYNKVGWLRQEPGSIERSATQLQTGDLVHLYPDPVPAGDDASHVFIFLSRLSSDAHGEVWLTAEGGQKSGLTSVDKQGEPKPISTYLCLRRRRMELASWTYKMNGKTFTARSLREATDGRRWVKGVLNLWTLLTARPNDWSGPTPDFAKLSFPTSPVPLAPYGTGNGQLPSVHESSQAHGDALALIATQLQDLLSGSEPPDGLSFLTSEARALLPAEQRPHRVLEAAQREIARVDGGSSGGQKNGWNRIVEYHRVALGPVLDQTLQAGLTKAGVRPPGWYWSGIFMAWALAVGGWSASRWKIGQGLAGLPMRPGLVGAPPGAGLVSASNGYGILESVQGNDVNVIAGDALGKQAVGRVRWKRAQVLGSFWGA